MRANEATTLRCCAAGAGAGAGAGHDLVLVPYGSHHVPRYHGWMKSEELLTLTASEPLSLEEEYAMQASWHADDDKCTFILLDGAQLPEGALAGPAAEQVAAEVAAMVGDVNLYLNDPDDARSAEVEVMVAEPAVRRRGLGRRAVLAMLQYGAGTLGMTRFTAKIGLDNAPSLGLFRRLGFAEISRSEVFKEATLELLLRDDAQQAAFAQLQAEIALSTTDYRRPSTDGGVQPE